jgi:CheY-like chemotaxis protein
LVVDDVPFNHQAIGMLLKYYDCQYDSAFDGKEAFTKV